MAVFRCRMCGADLLLTEGTSVATCEACGTAQTVPAADDERKMGLFARADRLLRACQFDRAAGVYESIAAEFPREAEAYWGLVLCKYGIEYVDDPATGKKIPTCHRSGFDSVLEDDDFAQAQANADVLARQVYLRQAETIEALRRDIVEVSGREAPYDVFICYKETAEDGGRTLDSVLAQDIYDALTEKGYRVFFSRVTLEDKLGQEYEPYIFAALNSARVMLAVGTCRAHYDAVWVKNEWSRFLQLMGPGKNKYLIPCFKNMDPYDMPKEFARLQSQDLGKVGAMQDLLRGVAKLLPAQAERARPFRADVPPIAAPAVTAAPGQTVVGMDMIRQLIREGRRVQAVRLLVQEMGLTPEKARETADQLQAEPTGRTPVSPEEQKLETERDECVRERDSAVREEQAAARDAAAHRKKAQSAKDPDDAFYESGRVRYYEERVLYWRARQTYYARRISKADLELALLRSEDTAPVSRQLQRAEMEDAAAEREWLLKRQDNAAQEANGAQALSELYLQRSLEETDSALAARHGERAERYEKQAAKARKDVAGLEQRLQQVQERLDRAEAY